MKFVSTVFIMMNLAIMVTSAQQTDKTWEGGLNYLLYIPEDDRQMDKKWPLLLFLHGSGERGSDLEVVKRHGPPSLIEEGRRFPFIVVSPQCPLDIRWSADTLTSFMDYLLSTYPVDRQRIYLTGLSMGGQGTWKLAKANPELFAALIPICGRTDTTGAWLLKDVPIWLFHGAKDDVVPLEQSEEMVKALRKYGSDVRFTVYPEAGHDSWTETYNNQEVYDWMMKQSKKEK